MISFKKQTKNTMSELEFCRNAHEGKLDLVKQKILDDKVEDLPRKKDSVRVYLLSKSS